jgi:hypothetical protein
MTKSKKAKSVLCNGIAESFISAHQTKAGGFNLKQLAEWGIAWPPKRGWRKSLVRLLASGVFSPPGWIEYRTAKVEAAASAYGLKNTARVTPRPAAGVSEALLKDFYASWDWKEARYEALKRLGAKCQCCGAMPKDARIVVDHIKPLRKRWDLRLDQTNLQVLCDDCNMGKSHRDETDWRAVDSDDQVDLTVSEDYAAFHLGGRFH